MLRQALTGPNADMWANYLVARLASMHNLVHLLLALGSDGWMVGMGGWMRLVRSVGLMDCLNVNAFRKRRVPENT